MLLFLEKSLGNKKKGRRTFFNLISSKKTKVEFMKMISKLAHTDKR